MLLNVKKIKVFEGPVSAELKDDRNGEELAHRHREGPFSAFFAVLQKFLCKSRFTNLTELIDVKENSSNFIIRNHGRNFS